MSGARVIDEDVERILSSGLPWEELAGRTVLVTGATGLVPAYVVETVLGWNARHPKDTARVVAVVRSREKAVRRFGERADVEIVVHDVGTPLPSGAVQGPVDFVVHAASPATPKVFGVDPIGTLAPNVFGTRDLLELAAAKASRAFLFVSSGEVYGIVDRELIKETDLGLVDPFALRSCYAESKRAGEMLCRAWHQAKGVHARVARLFHTYGPGMALDDGRVFADFVADVVAGRDIVMKSDGSAVRPYCYVADAVAGMFTILLRGSDAEAYNVGNARQAVSVLELAETLCRLFPPRRCVRSSDVAATYLKSPIPRNAPDTTKLEALGWRADTTIDAGFERTVRSYR